MCSAHRSRSSPAPPATVRSQSISIRAKISNGCWICSRSSNGPDANPSASLSGGDGPSAPVPPDSTHPNLPMELTNILAILGLIAGVAYLVVAVLAYRRSRGRHVEPDPQAGHVILSIEDEAGLIEGEPTYDRMHKLAAIAASIARRAFGED